MDGLMVKGLIALFVLGNALFFHFHPNGELKRRLLPLFTIAQGTLVGWILWHTLAEAEMRPQVRVAAVVLFSTIVFSPLVLTRFCDVCGRAVYGLQPPHFGKRCLKCDSELP